jgi:hypothetical protein
MTRRLTISLPDDVAERLDNEPNASAFIAEAVRHYQHGEQVAAALAADGLAVTTQGRSRARSALDQARQHAAQPEQVAARAALLRDLAGPDAEAVA